MVVKAELFGQSKGQSVVQTVRDDEGKAISFIRGKRVCQVWFFQVTVSTSRLSQVCVLIIGQQLKFNSLLL